ncbi:MAG: ATP-binding cassette domain-containing protein [Alphaproteobacteria bacterium]|nr:ATP-binding cassette domain-containing protein [Alphaproteobacteria bacterium]
MAPPLLILRDIFVTFGGTPLLEGAGFQVSAGDRLCLVGRNGSGKSTLLKVAAGLMEADAGERYVHPGATLRYLAQEPNLKGFATTMAYVEAGLAPGDDAHGARTLLERLGLTGDEDPVRLSGGEARRCALVRELAAEPDILFLDEPTNHLDLPAIEWLEDTLDGIRSALVLVSHDRRFLEKLTRRTVWLAQGVARTLDRGFGAFESWRDDVLEQEERARREMDRKLAAETEWLHKGVTARRKRNQGRLRALHALRAERRGQHGPTGTVKMATTEGATSGRLVIEAKDVTKGYGGAPVVRDCSLRVLRGDRIGIVGPNGAGKTTLLNLLTGALKPDSGSVRTGTALQMVTLDQRRESLDPTTTLSDALTGGGNMVDVAGQRRHVIGYMKDFLFAPEQARTPVGVLSGGERGRLMLARALARESNLLVLDEPTNDLDLETLDLLQEMLADYPGTVLLVSHDRDFLDRVVAATVAFEGDGRWVEYAGGYSDMIAQRRGGAADEAEPPKPKKSRPAEPKPRGAGGGKLSFRDKHALETLPARVEALTAEIAALQKALTDPQLYARDPAAFEAAAGRLEAAEAKRAKAEEQWLALEMKREEIEGG